MDAVTLDLEDSAIPQDESTATGAEGSTWRVLLKIDSPDQMSPCHYGTRARVPGPPFAHLCSGDLVKTSAPHGRTALCESGVGRVDLLDRPAQDHQSRGLRARSCGSAFRRGHLTPLMNAGRFCRKPEFINYIQHTTSGGSAVTESRPVEAKPLDFNRNGPILEVTLNRPSKANAMNVPMLAALDKVFDEVIDDDDIKVLIIKGAGAGFCAGYDIDSWEAKAPDGRVDPLVEYRRYDQQLRRWLRLWELPKITIAQVHGYCIGGAMQLAFMCDITYVAQDARIQYPAIRAGAGLIPPTWVHAIGPKRAKHLGLVAGASITGELSADWGWATAAYPADQLEEAVQAQARAIAIEPLGLLQLEKAAINRAIEATGFRSVLLTGALSNAVGHGSWASAEIHQQIAELGVKEFARRRTAAAEALR